MPVYIVHLSARHALDEVRRARDEGLPAYAETCPQYLFLTLDDLGNGFEGAKFICSPPLRPADHAPELWKGLAKDDLQVVSTDHCPFDFHGQKDLGQGDFRKVPNGLPGVEDRVNLLHSGGVVAGSPDAEPMGRGHLARPRRGCSASRVARASSRSGPMPTSSSTTRARSTRSARRPTTWTSTTRRYEGWEVTGQVETVLSRGKVIVDGDEWLGAAGDGRFLKRSPTGAAAGPDLIRPLDCSRRAICPLRRSPP